MNILDFLGLWPVLNNLDFVIGHGKTRRRNDVFQILYQLRVKFAFLCFDIKTSLIKVLEYFFNMLVMFGHVIQIDKYIIQIYHDIYIQKVRENVVYKSLKSYGSIGKTEEYYRLLKWSITCPKDSLPFIIVSDANQVVSIVKIYLWINSSFVRWVQ